MTENTDENIDKRLRKQIEDQRERMGIRDEYDLEYCLTYLQAALNGPDRNGMVFSTEALIEAFADMQRRLDAGERVPVIKIDSCPAEVLDAEVKHIETGNPNVVLIGASAPEHVKRQLLEHLQHKSISVVIPDEELASNTDAELRSSMNRSSLQNVPRGLGTPLFKLDPDMVFYAGRQLGKTTLNFKMVKNALGVTGPDVFDEHHPSRAERRGNRSTKGRQWKQKVGKRPAK